MKVKQEKDFDEIVWMIKYHINNFPITYENLIKKLNEYFGENI